MWNRVRVVGTCCSMKAVAMGFSKERLIDPSICHLQDIGLVEIKYSSILACESVVLVHPLLELAMVEGRKGPVTAWIIDDTNGHGIYHPVRAEQGTRRRFICGVLLLRNPRNYNALNLGYNRGLICWTLTSGAAHITLIIWARLSLD